MAMKASMLRPMVLLMVFTAGGIVQWSFAQVPDLEVLDRQLEERKAEEARQQARRAEEERRAAERCLQNRFEVANGGVSDCQLGVVWASADNGRDINWPDSMSYCRSLGPGWGLPSVFQLLSLYARDTTFSRSVLGFSIYPTTALIQFTANWYWSAEVYGSSQAGGVDLAVGGWGWPPQSSLGRALCVRRL